MSNFRSLDVVGRGGEKQLQVGGKLNKIISRFKRVNSNSKQFLRPGFHVMISNY